MKNLFLCLTFFICVNTMTNAQETIDIFTYRLGHYKVSLLSEAQQKASPAILIGATPEILNKYAPDGSFYNAMNAFLIQNGDGNILVDTGLGKHLFFNLHTLGVRPENIDIILITHMHGDHIGGMLQNGEVMFPNADIYISRPEHDYWMSDDKMYQAPEDRRMSFNIARKVIREYADRLTLFDPQKLNSPAEELIMGITPFEAYGHTPGHTAFLVESGNSKLMIWGDLTHAMAIQMPHPELPVTYDVNPELAVESRKQILQYVAEKYIPIAGMHISYPGMGHISTSPEGEGYIFTPF